MRKAFTFPDDWQSDILSEVAHILPGKTPSKEEYRSVGDIKMIKFRDMSEGGGVDFSNDDEGWIDSSQTERTNLVTLQPETILLTNAAHSLSHIGKKIGYVEVLPHSIPTCFVGELTSIRAKSAEVNTLWLYYLLQTEPLRREIAKAAEGAHLVPYWLKRVPLARPEKLEQIRIAETLKAADDHIRAIEVQIHKVERVKRATVHDLFSKGCRRRGQHEFKKTEIGLIPSDWVVAPLSKICGGPDCVKTGPFGAQLPPEAFSASGIRMLNITDIGDGEILWKSLFHVSPDAFARLGEYELCEGDIAFSRVADVGRLACIRKEHEPLLMSSNCIRLRTQPAFNAKFLTHVFKDATSVARQVVAMSNAGGRPIVTPRFLRQMKVPCPPMEEQNSIATIIEHFETLHFSLCNQLTAARRVKQSLLQNLLTGKIRLKA